MTEEFVFALGRDALSMVLLLTAPVLGLGLLVGLVVSLFQATTQINEQTLAFIPKIAAVFVALLFFGPWMVSTLLDYTRGLFAYLPELVR